MRATLTFLSPNQIDTCIRDCSIEASKKVGCISPLHLSCICPNGQSNAQFQGAAVGCLLKNGCNLSNALATNSNLCKYGVDCVAPYKNCETSSGETICIDPSIQTCASGSVINLQRRALAVANAGCTPGQEACRVFGGGLFAYECIDTTLSPAAAAPWTADRTAPPSSAPPRSSASRASASSPSARRVSPSSLAAASKHHDVVY